MTDKNPEASVNEFRDLTNAIMKRKSLSLYEAQKIAANFFTRNIKPDTKEFETEMDKVKTLWEV